MTMMLYIFIFGWYDPYLYNTHFVLLIVSSSSIICPATTRLHTPPSPSPPSWSPKSPVASPPSCRPCSSGCSLYAYGQPWQLSRWRSTNGYAHFLSGLRWQPLWQIPSVRFGSASSASLYLPDICCPFVRRGPGLAPSAVLSAVPLLDRSGEIQPSSPQSEERGRRPAPASAEVEVEVPVARPPAAPENRQIRTLPKRQQLPPFQSPSSLLCLPPAPPST